MLVSEQLPSGHIHRVVGGNLPLDSHGKLPGAGARLNNNVALLDARGQELLLRARDEGTDNGRVPAGVDNGDTEAGAFVLLRGRAFERHTGEK